jgi:hypothetical protein
MRVILGRFTRLVVLTQLQKQHISQKLIQVCVLFHTDLFRERVMNNIGTRDMGCSNRVYFYKRINPELYAYKCG